MNFRNGEMIHEWFSTNKVKRSIFLILMEYFEDRVDELITLTRSSEWG